MASLWDSLKRQEKINYKTRLEDAIKRWRQFTSPVAQNVNGGTLHDPIIGHCLRRTAPTRKNLGRTTDEWLEDLKEDLKFGLSRLHKTKDPLVIEEKYQDLKQKFPKSEPYVLTHGDLNFSNIIVKDNKIEAIIDWEHAEYYPWWVERYLAIRWGCHQSDQVFNSASFWKNVGQQMDKDTFVREVFRKVYPVTEAWEEGMFNKHSNTRPKWLIPRFCDCKRYLGKFDWRDIGNPSEHKLPIL